MNFRIITGSENGFRSHSAFESRGRFDGLVLEERKELLKRKNSRRSAKGINSVTLKQTSKHNKH